MISRGPFHVQPFQDSMEYLQQSVPLSLMITQKGVR